MPAEHDYSALQSHLAYLHSTLLCYVDLPNQLSASLGISASCSLQFKCTLGNEANLSRRENASCVASIGLIKWGYWKTRTCQSVLWLCRQQYLGRHWKAAPFEHPIFYSVKSSKLFFAGCDTCKSRGQQTVKFYSFNFKRSCSPKEAVSGQELPLGTGQCGERFWSQRSSHPSQP